LAGDRSVSLFRQACCEGLINPRQADLLNRKWWWNLWRTLDYLENRNQLRILDLLHARHCAAIDYATEQKTFDHHWDWAGKLQSMEAKILLPWVPVLDKKAQIRAMQSEWERHWGSYSDPSVRQKVEDACEQMRSLAAQGRKRTQNLGTSNAARHKRAQGGPNRRDARRDAATRPGPRPRPA